MWSSRCPTSLSALALQNKKVIYDLLFRASAETLLEDRAPIPNISAPRSASSACCTPGDQKLLQNPHS